MSPKHIFYTLFLGLSLCLASCNGGSSDDDDTDTGDSRTTSDESFFKDKCELDSEDDCFELREDVTVFNPDDFSDVEEFNVIHIDRDQGQLKDGDIVVEMMLRDGAPLPEPVEVGRIIYRKKKAGITVRRIKAIQQDGNKARFLTERVQLVDVFKRWRFRGRYEVDWEAGEVKGKLADGEEPNDRFNFTKDCLFTETIDAWNEQLDDSIILTGDDETRCKMTFKVTPVIQNVGGFLTKNGVSEIGIEGTVTIDIGVGVQTTRRVNESASVLVDLFPTNNLKDRVVVKLGVLTLKIGARAKINISSDKANTFKTGFTASIVAGPVVRKTARKGYSFQFFDQRGPSDEPGGADGKCTGDDDDDNPCFSFEEPYLAKEGNMTITPTIEPEVLVTSPYVAGLGGVTLGFNVYNKFTIEGMVDKTSVDNAASTLEDVLVEQTTCVDSALGFAPTLGMEVAGKEVLETTLATFENTMWGECYPLEYTVSADGCGEIDSDDKDSSGDGKSTIDRYLKEQGICLVNRHCSAFDLIENNPDRPDVQCMRDQPDCDADSCICQEPDPAQKPLLESPELIRGAWFDSPEDYCCLPIDQITEQIALDEALAGDDPNKKGEEYWMNFNCSDKDPLTINKCINGRCQYTLLPGACIEASDCNAAEIWVSEDGDRAAGEPIEGLAVSVVPDPECIRWDPEREVDGDLIEKRWGAGVRTVDDLVALGVDDGQYVEYNRYLRDITPALHDIYPHERVKGKRKDLGTCYYPSDTSEIVSAVGFLPETHGLDCNVSNQHIDCDDGIAFTLDYCGIDPEVLKADWPSPEEAPRKWGRCYHGMGECPKQLGEDFGNISIAAMKPCCEERIGRKIKPDESWRVQKLFIVGDPETEEDTYDWTCLLDGPRPGFGDWSGPAESVDD